MAALAWTRLPISTSRAPVRPCDRRADVGIGEVELRRIDLRLVGGDRRGGLVDRALLLVVALPRLEPLADQRAVAVEVELGGQERRRILRLGRGRLVERRLEGAGIDLEQPVALLDVLAFLKQHLHDLAVDARAYGNGIIGLDRASPCTRPARLCASTVPAVTGGGPPSALIVIVLGRDGAVDEPPSGGQSREACSQSECRGFPHRPSPRR